MFRPKSSKTYLISMTWFPLIGSTIFLIALQAYAPTMTRHDEISQTLFWIGTMIANMTWDTVQYVRAVRRERSDRSRVIHRWW